MAIFVIEAGKMKMFSNGEVGDGKAFEEIAKVRETVIKGTRSRLQECSKQASTL